MELKLVLDPNSFLKSSHPTPPPTTTIWVFHGVKFSLWIPSHKLSLQAFMRRKKKSRNQRNMWVLLLLLCLLSGLSVLPLYKILPENGAASYMWQAKAGIMEGERGVKLEGEEWVTSWRQWILSKKEKETLRQTNKQNDLRVCKITVNWNPFL